uniref:Ninjurin n=1 Tax=Anopheles atroparvus TaxID=41427 RepID=A0AAG5DG12_ANOAO
MTTAVDPVDSKQEGRKLQKSVSNDLSEDEDYISVADSDSAEKDGPLMRSVGYVSLAMADDSQLVNEKKVPEENGDMNSTAEPKRNNNKLNAELTSFVQKKSFAQNMMDIALLSANTNQLRYVIDLGEKHPYYSTSLFLIVLSLVMQVVVGLSMLYMSRYNMKNKTEMKEASHMNNLSVAGVFLVTLVNVFISTFNGAGGEGLMNSADPVPIVNTSAVSTSTSAYIIP